jgi:hypothetical protein
VDHHRADVHEDVTLDRTEEGQPVQANHPRRLATEVCPRGEVRVHLEPPHQLSAVERSVEVDVADLHRLDRVDVGLVRRARRPGRALPGETEIPGEHLQQLADQQRPILLADLGEVPGGRLLRELTLLQLPPELAPELALAEERSLRRRLRTELRHDHRLPRLVEPDEGHVRGEDLSRRQRVGAAARHRDVDPHAALGRVGNACAQRDVLADADRIAQLDSIDRRRHHRPAAVARRRQHADHVHPLEHLARLQEPVRVADMRAHPLVEVNLVAGPSLLHTGRSVFGVTRGVKPRSRRVKAP